MVQAERQVRRLCKRLARDGPAGLAHRARGRQSNHRLSDDVRDEAIRLISERYHDFGPTLAREKLLELHGLDVSVETARKWMMAAGLWRDREQRRRRPQQPRRRRPCRGELVQIDGCDHDRFEDRGPRCTLLVFIDDATSELMELRFVESESAFSYFAATRAYLERHGKPVAFYSDQAAVFRVAREDARGGKGMTQFGRALHELNIDIICANTPAAKGRVERSNLTLQDRPVKELRLAGVSDMAAGNAWIEEYRASHNRRFAVPPSSPRDAHRELLASEDLDRIFTWQETRKVASDLTLRYRRQLFVLDDTPAARAARGNRADVVEEADGSVTVWWRGKHLPATAWAKDYRTSQAEVVPNKRLAEALKWARQQQEAREEKLRASGKLSRRQSRALSEGTSRRPASSSLLKEAG